MCDKNKLTTLPLLNENLQYFDCNFNNLNYIPCLNATYNALERSYDLRLTHINDIRTQNEILYNFRKTYYTLKFKKHFKRWLWEKVREPKIMAKFHPSHLTNLLDTDDLEVFLEDWIKNDFVK